MLIFFFKNLEHMVDYFKKYFLFYFVLLAYLPFRS